MNTPWSYRLILFGLVLLIVAVCGLAGPPRSLSSGRILCQRFPDRRRPESDFDSRRHVAMLAPQPGNCGWDFSSDGHFARPDPHALGLFSVLLIDSQRRSRPARPRRDENEFITSQPSEDTSQTGVPAPAPGLAPQSSRPCSPTLALARRSPRTRTDQGSRIRRPALARPVAMKKGAVPRSRHQYFEFAASGSRRCITACQNEPSRVCNSWLMACDSSK